MRHDREDATGGGVMPLPDTDQLWPPADCRGEIERKYQEWGAWYSGEPQRLRDFYQVSNGFGSMIDPKQWVGSGGGSLALSQVSRFFWGNPPEPGSVRDAKLHIPLAGDIAGTSADLLFSEPPTFEIEGEAEQVRLDKIVDNGLIPALHESAEICSALGGAYLRVTVDPVMFETPTYDVIPPESAVPEWRSGRLNAVTFWRNLHRDHNGNVYRHLERHEIGWVYHGLYLGTDTNLGQPQPLEAHPDTAEFAALVDDSGRMETGADTLTAEYIPNMRPNRLMRGSQLGRSDYQGVETTMDALDETWSSLMRDIRLSKSRLVVPESYLESNGAGRGARFNTDRELFTPIKAMPSNEGVSLELVQFAIRVDEHLTTCRNLAVQGLRGAGYSAQSFGEGDQGGPATATEIQARERRSFMTRDRKIGYWRPPLIRLIRAGLQMDRRFYGSAISEQPEWPNVEWPDGVQTDIETTSRVVQMLDAAGAVSQRTKVQMVHPQWDSDQVDSEVEMINAGGNPIVETDNQDDVAPPPESDLTDSGVPSDFAG